MSVVAHPAPLVGENVTRLVPYRPGKPIEEVQRELGLTHVTKLASNENALGPSPQALHAAREAAARVALYPDAACHALREAMAAHLGVPEDHLVFGNGSDDLIHLLGVTFLTPDAEMIMGDPSFVRYEASATLNESPCHKVPLADWTHDLDAMAERINARTRLLYIANPNNPTGTYVTDAAVRRFMARVPDQALVVFDEAYFEYVDVADYPDSLAYVREGRNVVVLRTFSKAYGLAGLRLGYGVCPPIIAGYLHQVREPFNVSLIAQSAGIAALADQDHVRRSIDMNRNGKQAFYAAFDRLGLAYAPTQGNFVWVDVGRDCREIYQALLRRGIIVRTGDIFGAPNHLRVTIGTADQNTEFLTALEDLLS